MKFKELLEAKMPSKSEQDKLVKVFATKMSLQKQNAPIKKQQKADGDFRKIFDKLQTKYPNVDMSSDLFDKQLQKKAEKLLSSKLFRGAGSEF